jgi:hypothetical protein
MSWWDDIQGFFSPEAGQQRRQWLNRQEDTVGDVMRGYLGPAAQPIGNMAQIAGLLSPGADMMEAADASRGMWNADNPLDAAVAGATMLGATGMMFLPGNFSALQEGVGSVADDLVRAYDPSRVNAITAYHGSPHTFDRFDISKIGTGEGAQAYGHGLYFAENEAVARGYREALSGAQPFDLQSISPDAYRRLEFDIDNFAGRSTPDIINQEAANFVTRGTPAPWMNEETIEALRNANLPARNPGSLYQVQINADPSQLLDWDAPLSAQPGPVREGVINALTQHGLPVDESGVPRWLNSADPDGQSIRASLASFSPTGNESRLLLENGIPGIKYLDQGSRAAGDGSRNFVIFDDSIVDILKRYGIGAAAVGGGWALAPDEAQAAQSAGLFDPAANDRQILMDWLDSQGL